MSVSLGIHAFGAYIPALRISRQEMAAFHSWMNPTLVSAQSERSAANWDEDTVTMAVEASRNCLTGVDRESITGIYLGTTTAPYADRLNSGIVASTLRLPDSALAVDATGSQRAGTTALRLGLDAVAARGGRSLCLASERRATLGATSEELATGHGAAGLLVGEGPGLARLVGAASTTVDFIDHFRASAQEFDYQWEDRWIRDEGYQKLVPTLVGKLLDEVGIRASEISAFCLPSRLPTVDQLVAKSIGIQHAAVADALVEGCGNTGAAHSLLMLVSALEVAKPGEKLLVVAFGQGVDAFLFEATEALPAYQMEDTGTGRWLGRRSSCSYSRYLALNEMIKIGRGIRAEANTSVAFTAMYRHKALLASLSGGCCERCGTYQLPRTRMCVNPACAAVDSQASHSFADSTATVVSWSADNLTYTPDPPAYYGLIDFAEGGRLLVDFTDIGRGGIEVGVQMRMVFRVKNHDRLRGFTSYFWKATPAEPERTKA